MGIFSVYVASDKIVESIFGNPYPTFM